MRGLVISLLAVMAASAGLMVSGARDAAWAVSSLGTVGVLLVALAYVAAVDSRRRWPDADWLVRLGRVFFFER